MYHCCFEGFAGEVCDETNFTSTAAPTTEEMVTVGPCTADEDSCLGHFTCDVFTGVITCLPGFTGDMCTVRVPDGKNAAKYIDSNLNFMFLMS